MVPTFTWGFFRSNTPFAMTLTSERGFPIADFRLPISNAIALQSEIPTELPQGLEPWTSTLPRWRSTTELWQRRGACSGDRHLFGPVRCDKLCAYRDLRRAESINREE